MAFLYIALCELTTTIVVHRWTDDETTVVHYTSIIITLVPFFFFFFKSTALKCNKRACHWEKNRRDMLRMANRVSNIRHNLLANQMAQRERCFCANFPHRWICQNQQEEFPNQRVVDCNYSMGAVDRIYEENHQMVQKSFSLHRLCKFETKRDISIVDETKILQKYRDDNFVHPLRWQLVHGP